MQSLFFLQKSTAYNQLITRTFYTIPEKYRNAFFLANASLFDYTNYYIHKAYETCFPTVLSKVQKTYPECNSIQARDKVLNVIELLEPCNGMININFPVKKSDGTYEVIKGCRAMHALKLYETPCLGGMRLCSDLKKDHVKAFSVLSTYKHACFGIHMAGAHGGLEICGFSYEPEDMKNIIVSYGKELAKHGFLGCQVDILEPDLYCGAREMGWIAEEFGKSHDSLGFACAVGKPEENGGIKMYDKALPYGVLSSLGLFLKNDKIVKTIGWEGSLKDKTFIIQGLGKSGSQLARMLVDVGAICTGVKEHDAFIYMDEGIPIEKLLEHKEENGSIIDFNKYTKPIATDHIFTEPCDILILAATHRSLQCHVAERVKAKIIVEAAYASVTPSAYKVLVSKGKLVLPDIFAGAGASIASYLEFVKNINNSPLNVLISRLANLSITSSNELLMKGDAGLRSAIDNMMNNSYENIVTHLALYDLGLDVRTAAYTVAIEKIFNKICEEKKF